VASAGIFEATLFIMTLLFLRQIASRLVTSLMIATAILISLHAISLQLSPHFPQKMFCVHVAGDELATLAHNFRQNGFAIPVN
jgi:hypothetical protein